MREPPDILSRKVSKGETEASFRLMADAFRKRIAELESALANVRGSTQIERVLDSSAVCEARLFEDTDPDTRSLVDQLEELELAADDDWGPAIVSALRLMEPERLKARITVDGALRIVGASTPPSRSESTRMAAALTMQGFTKLGRVVIDGRKVTVYELDLSLPALPRLGRE